MLLYLPKRLHSFFVINKNLCRCYARVIVSWKRF